MAYDPATRFRVALPDEAALLREEVADVVGLTPEERIPLLAAACKGGMQLLALKSAPDRLAILEHQEPLPESAQRALARLRARYRGGA